MPSFQGKPVYRPQVQMTKYGQGMTVAPPPVEYEDEEKKKFASAGANPPNPPDDNSDKNNYIKPVPKKKKFEW